jgi:maleate isomerase
MAFENAGIDPSRTRDRPQRENGRQVNYVGHRARIGVVVPSTNTSVEYDCQRIVPRGVSWHTTRFLITHTDLSDDENFVKFLRELRETIGDSITALMTCKPDHVMMGMSAETFWGDDLLIEITVLGPQHRQLLTHLTVVRSLVQWVGLRYSAVAGCFEISPPAPVRKPMLSRRARHGGLRRWKGNRGRVTC